MKCKRCKKECETHKSKLCFDCWNYIDEEYHYKNFSKDTNNTSKENKK